MIDCTGVEIRDEHVEALRAYLSDDPESEVAFDDESPTHDVIAFSVMIYAGFSVAARRKFYPRYFPADVIQYVANTRIALGEDGVAIHPRLAEELLRDALADASFDPKEQEAEPAILTQAALLGALLGEADLDEGGMEKFIEEATGFAREWVAARQGDPSGI